MTTKQNFSNIVNINRNCCHWQQSGIRTTRN